MRSVETEENKQFVEQVGRGIVPRELRDRAENQDVDVSVVDKRSESFDPGPQPSYVAFSGEGQRLRCAAATQTGRGPSLAETSAPLTPSPRVAQRRAERGLLRRCCGRQRSWAL